MAADKGVCVLFLVAFLAGFPHLSDGFKCASKGSTDPNSQLQIHMVPHTHDDVGWLKTVDQYYYGANNSIARAGVQYILDSVIPQLVSDPSKKFIYVEMAFFKRWWDEQSDAMKATVKKLVKDRQLEFINGGWCMNDEAATHYNAIIDQMTYGLKFIKDNFGDVARPRIAWHIDPFGHSAEQASLFSQMSFEGFFFARIDYQDKAVRKDQQRLEMIWRGSKSLGKATEIFTGVTYNGYGPPPGFCFDSRGCNDPPIMDDPNMFDVNVKNRVEAFIQETCEQAEHYKSGHIMLTMGEDFNYQNANMYYKNMDKLIKYVNKDGRVNAFYSTPSIYTDAVRKSGVSFETKTDDFFPYADCPHCYWTGYFTSRPALKGYVRKNNNLLQICKQLEVGSKKSQGDPSSVRLREAMAVAQHHDAVSGTAKQHVTNDYALRLAIGEKECQGLVGKALSDLSIKAEGAPGINYTYCNYLNISACSITEGTKSFTVTLYNPLARHVDNPVNIPISVASAVVTDSEGSTIESQIVPVSQQTKDVRGKFGAAGYTLMFAAEVPAMGFTTVFVNLNAPRLRFDRELKSGAHVSEKEKVQEDSDIVISGGDLGLTFSSTTGMLKQMSSLKFKRNIDIAQNFLWYNSSVGTQETQQESGAYIFRPNKSAAMNVNDGKVKIEVFKGPVVEEVRQVFSPFVSQVIRLYKGWSYAEFEYTVGPIPIEDGFGKEIISRFDTSVDSGDMFYTDANGREMQERKVNYRPAWKLNVTEPVAGNYYPVNSRIYIKDQDTQFTVMNDRSQGGSSLKSGSVEVMVHRRTLKDDRRGVGEPLNETAFGRGLIVRGKFYVLLTSVAGAAAVHRTLGEQILLQPKLAFAANYMGIKEWMAKYHTSYNGTLRELPANVHLLTLETMDDGILLRLEHQFEKDEDPTYSQPVTIKLDNLFTGFKITSLTEMNLAANQLLSDKETLYWKAAEEKNNQLEDEFPNTIGDGHTVTLNPMQIRTFKATIAPILREEKIKI